ncbi:hypothetical protein [Mycolicibacterium mageritense]|uniref:hypothetical protein n=1 Tax=Mycolicibacterium mageritense TaxID=53462 RepID=UPI001E625EE9|nr:hypothetical protein [Mycolicibacterium mageritense]GJJ24053.1 hypothetical protein MTY414_77270 [Mycolicibacterium mageritense]
MKRRDQTPAGGYLFLGKVYPTAAEYLAAKAAWQARKDRLYNFVTGKGDDYA